MRKKTRFLIILLAIIAIIAILLTAFILWRGQTGKKPVETAVSVQMMKTEGTVTVTNNSAREMKVMENMRLYNGYFLSTDEESYAWVNLDDTKLAKLDAVSRMELRKDGKKLQILVYEGTLFFNVTEPLGDEETMDIRTSTMVAGIRGTSGWIRETDSMNTELCILEGETECTVTNPVTGEQKTGVVSSGEVAQLWGNEEEGTCGIDIRKAEQEDIPGFALKEIEGDAKLQEKIFSLSGMDLRNLTDEEADARLETDRADTALQLKQIEARDSGKKVISKDPVWKEVPDDTAGETQPAAEENEEPVTEPATDSETESSTEKNEEPVTEPATDSETESNTEKNEEPVTEPATDSETESNTEKNEEPVTEPATDSETEPVIEPEPEIYTVTYMLDGEQVGEVETYEYGAAVPLREKAVKEGYTVSDWSRKEDFTMPAEDVVITASSTVNSYTVTYKLDGEQIGEAETYKYGEAVSLRKKAAKEGYTVTDWSRKEDFTMPAEDVVITASSTVNSYIVTYKLDGEQIGEAETYKYGEAVSIREKVTKVGHTVTDWSRTEAFTMPAENVVITATSEINSYTVTYMLDGTQTGEVEIYEYGEAVHIRANAEKEGYTVTDWSRTEAFTMPAENVVITATSEINSYTVTYMLDGTQTGEVEIYEYGEAVHIRANAEKEGYTVTDWSRTEDFAMPAENVVITATSEINSYTVTYMLDGTQTGEVEIYEYGEAVHIRANVEKEGYIVTDWSRTEDFTMPAENVVITATSEIYQTGDFTVVGGIPEKDYSYSGTELTILTDTPVSISGSTTKDTIAVADSSVTANVTLSNVSIELDSNYNKSYAFSIPEQAGATITLEGTNVFKVVEGNSAALKKKGTTGLLTIKGSGSLEAIGGIGIGSADGDVGNIIIESGIITATGKSGAGIGSGYICKCTNITIKGGDVTATGTESGAGIGSGRGDCGSNITILGGKVTAVGGDWAAGIGGGSNQEGSDGSHPYGRGENITISGGVVTATGGSSGGAGIGGGYYGGDGINISITGGVVTATGGNKAAGIGGGGNQVWKNDKGGDGTGISITGGIVTTAGGTDSPSHIGGGHGVNNGTSDVTRTGGIIFEGTSGQVYGEVTLDSNLEIMTGETLEIPSGAKLHISNGAKLIIQDGATVTNNGTITYEAGTQSEAISGNLVNSGTISGPVQPQGNSETGEAATQLMMWRKEEEWMSLLNTEED